MLVAGIAALVGRRFIKKIEKPERTLETLRDLPEVLHREAPGERHRDVPEVSNGQVQLRGHRLLHGLTGRTPHDRPPGRAAGRDQRPAARARGPTADISANGVGLHVAEAGERAARAAAARLPAVLVDLALAS